MHFAGMLKWDYYWCDSEACVYTLTFEDISLLLNLKGELIGKNIKYFRSRLDLYGGFNALDPKHRSSEAT